MDASPFNRKRPSGGAVLQLHQEAQCQPAACKRRCRRKEEEEMKTRRRRSRAGGSCEENKDPRARLQRNIRTQNLRRSSQSGTRTKSNIRTVSTAGLRSGVMIQSCRPEVKVAQIRKTRIRTSVQTLELREARSAKGDMNKEQTDPGAIETQLDHRRPNQVHQSSSESRSTAGLISEWSSETRNNRKRSERHQGPESCRGEGGPQRIRSKSEGKAESGIRKRRKIHPSEFRGRGQLRLSITPEAGQLIIDIYKAKGLLGKSQWSCDSYVKLVVSSEDDRSIKMKTPTVLSNKNPEYNHSFILCISDNILRSRLLVSVFNRCNQLIGCMSFGIGSLVSSSKPVSGWFYLLGEDFGQSKHLRVAAHGNKPMRSQGKENRPAQCADLRKTPDSTPDTDLNHIATTTTSTTVTSLSNYTTTNTTTTGLKDLTNYGLDPINANYRSGPANTNYSSYVSSVCNSNQQQATRDNGSIQRLTVNIVRGKDGFGFTICSDCPVRVQAVDSGGPAHLSGLRQGDSVLQLNGHPVETWKCADVAHAIRSCPSQIVLVVWRGLPELRTSCEGVLHQPAQSKTSGRKLLSHPTHSKHGRRRGQGLGVRSSFGALGSLWRDRKENRDEEEEEEEEAEEQEMTEYSPHTTTLKGTRVTSSNGDNYIILSPVNQGGQLLQPVYHDRNGTIGRLYQTHPSRGHGQNLLHDPRPGTSRRPYSGCTSTLPPPTTSSTSSISAPPSSYGNYQNCTIVQSHLPCSTYGTYVTLAPKTLIFPIFVQPLDLCSPDRTLLMAEEMVLHQNDLLPSKVTVLIYSDLLLFTREDEVGRCNVLQSPVYLNTLQLREVPSEPLQIYFLQSSQGCWRCLFSLEAFSIEQKVRVSLCLHDNIQLQLISTDSGRSHQLSDLPSDFGLLSLGQSDLLYRPSSPYSTSDPPLLNPSSPFSSSFRPPSPSPYPASPIYTSPTPPPPPFSSLSPYATLASNPPRTFATTTQNLPPSLVTSSSKLRSPVWKERGQSEEEERRKKKREEEEEEERQQGEGESASETSENVGGVGGRGLMLSPLYFNMKGDEDLESDDDEEEQDGGCAQEFVSTHRPEVLRRSLSEGTLMKEPRSPRFLSDSTIHRLTHPATCELDLATGPTPRRPSIHTLRKQLTKEGGSLHHMILLLNGTKDAELRNLQLRKKTRNLAADVRNRLPFLRRRKNSSCVQGNSLEKALRNTRPSTKEVLRWAESLEALLTNQYGLAVFRHFLRSEFSEENLDFWLAVEKFKKTRPLSKIAIRASKIYDEFISTKAARQVNVDSSVRESTNQSLCQGVNLDCFQLAQDQIFGLMETDSYPRFLRSHLYAQLASQGVQTTASANRNKAGPVPVGQS
ncbi:regulator of G-protein signaling 3-like [Cheilinus undulatus]|uniref:regulator of G-protein signaling 3-like n=1 Tax=Cheilinus undulatus TaxID=241271 RepID=UPI001BD2000C|nr:regulator of G-protein signaling 3-like [Cheilinus undulatus]